MSDHKQGKTELYRHFDKDGRLLYVGISMSTVARLCEHRLTSAWCKKVTTITIERYPSRKAALEAERQAVQSENPIHNVTGKLRGFRHGFAYVDPEEKLKADIDAIMTAHRAEVAARQNQTEAA